MPTAKLVAHQLISGTPSSRIDVDATATSDGLALSYRLKADVQNLRIPAISSPTRTDDLWRHTCFEAFVRGGETSAYCEINLSPSTQWAVYGFSGYREGLTRPVVESPPRMSVRREPDRLQLDAQIDLAMIPSLRASGTLQLALSAVLEDTDGRLSYWALTHPSDKPDFHHPASFIMQLHRKV